MSAAQLNRIEAILLRQDAQKGEDLREAKRVIIEAAGMLRDADTVRKKLDVMCKVQRKLEEVIVP